MKIALIAPAPAAFNSRITSLDPCLELVPAFTLFGPEIVADWPAQTVDWYVPSRVREVVDTLELKRQRDELLGEAEVLCITFPFPTRLASRAPRLRYVHQVPAGVSNLMQGDLWGTSVPVSSGRGVNRSLPIAEWVIGSTIALMKDLPLAFAQRARGRFDRTELRGRLVAGKTIGIVGLGGIGRQVARLAHALGMRVVGSNRSGEPVEHVERVYGPGELHQLLAESHIAVLATQLTPETHHLMDAAAFAAMQAGSFLVNVARGELIDEAALIEALRAGTLAGFAADVYEGEFEHQPPSELLAFDNVMLTPHTSGHGDVPSDESLEIFVENLRRLLAGEPLLNLVDWARGY